jgi:hypothetical protein
MSPKFLCRKALPLIGGLRVGWVVEPSTIVHDQYSLECYACSHFNKYVEQEIYFDMFNLTSECEPKFTLNLIAPYVQSCIIGVTPGQVQEAHLVIVGISIQSKTSHDPHVVWFL